MPKKEEEKAIELSFNPNLPNYWIDTISFAVRDDNICLLRLFTSLPEGHIEQTRFLTTKENLQSFIDTICSAMDHYPEKKKKKSSKID